MNIEWIKKLEPAANIYKNINENKAKHRIKFVINTHVNYMEETLRIMYPSARREIPADELLVVVGGSPENKVEEINGVTFGFMKQNLYDFHSFVFILKNPEYFEGFDYIFYLHDTCIPLPYFKELAYNFKSGVDTCRVWSRSNSNLGLYKLDYLRGTKKSYIMNTLASIKNGRQGVQQEDRMHTKSAYNRWESLTEPGIVGDKFLQAMKGQLGWKDVYGTGNARRVMLYKNLNLIKLKSDSSKGGYGGTKKKTK